MFETILEKILIQYFGKFISGLDKNNLKLGVWSGNVVIENVNLKSEIIELLELPIILNKSKVGRLIIKIPWKKLTSQPVEITIENVYVTLSPMKELIFDDRVIVQKKLETIITYFKKCIKKGTKQKKEKDKGYFDKIALKIMDNIQLKIVNIHIRYESNYCWGVTMEMLEIYSTNQAWQRSFIERPENQNLSLNKLFSLKNLAFYWNINQDDEALNYDNFMDERVLKANLTAKEFCNFIVIINAEMKVIQNDPSTTLAQQDMKLELEDIYLILKQKQFSQMVHFFNFCSKYSKILWVQKKQSQSLQENVQGQQKRFDIILKKIAFSGYEQLEEEEKQQLQSIIRVVKNNILLEWVSILACQIVKESKQNKALQEKIKKENAWWKSEKKPTKEIELSQEEILTINSQIDKFFQEYKAQISNRSDDSIETEFSFMIQRGCFKLENSRDGLELNFEKLQIQFETKVDQSVNALFKLSNLSSDLILENQNFPFFYKATSSEKLDQFVKFHFQKHPKSSDIYASFMFQIEPIECKYNKKILQQWDIYFNTDDMKENVLETAVIQSIHEAGNQTANIVETFMNSQYRVQIFIMIANPKVIINDLNFNFGTISIQSEKDQKEYDQYTLSIDQLNLKSKEIEILKQLSLQLQVERIKAGLAHLHMPRLIISGILPPLELKLTESLFEQIKQIENEIFPEKTILQKQRQWKKEKHAIVKNSTYQGLVHKKTENLWAQYYLIISGNYLYCYNQKEDLQWSERMNTNDIDVKDNQEELIIFGEKIWILKTENESKLELKHILSNLDQKQKLQDNQIDKSLLQIQLKISSLKIGLFNELQSLYTFHLEDMFYRSHKQSYKFENSLIIGEFYIIDYTLNENQQILIQKNKECKDALLTIENIIEQNCSRTKVSFSILEINWNPDSFLAIRELGNYLDKILGIETQRNQRINIKERTKKSDILFLLEGYKERNFETTFYNYFDDLIDRKKVEELCIQNNIFFKNWSFNVGTQIELQISHIKLNLILRKTQLQIGYVEIVELSHIAEFTQNGKFFNGTLKSFRAHDLTQTRSNQKNDIKQLIEIIHLQDIVYKWTSYKKELYKDKDELITSLCYFSALDVVIEYHHLTINRFLNFLNFQIIQLLTNPLLLTINDGEYSEIEKEEIFLHQISHNLKNPQFPLYKYKLQNVKLNLKKCYDTPHTLNFVFPLLIYQNQFKLWEKISFSLQDCKDQNLIAEQGIYDIKNGQLMLNNDILVQNFCFKYNQLKPIMELEFKNIFKEQFQSVLGIDLELYSQTLVTLTKQNYIMMCTILAHNILQNDEQDQIYMYDFHHYSKLKQTQIQANLILDNLLFQLSEFDISINLQNTKLQINQMAKTIQLMLEANKYEINLKDKLIASNQNTIFFKKINQIQKDPQQQQLNKKTFSIQYNVQLNTSALIIDVFEGQCYGNYLCYFQILEFLQLDNSIFPYDKEKEVQKNEVIIFNWKGSCIFSNEYESDIVMASGSINLVLELQSLKKLYKITFSNFEAFLCKPEETEFKYPNNDFIQRQLLFPLFIYLQVKVNDENRQVQVEVSADDLKVLLSQNDFQLLYKIYLYQKKQLNQFSFNQQKTEQNKNKDTLVELHAQIHHSGIQLIQFFENNIPLFSFELKDSQFKYVEKNKYLMNCSTIFEIQFFNLDIGTWEPLVEPLQLICDHSVDQFGNPKQFTSISLNESNLYPTNINFTKESIKALIEILRKISNLQKQLEPQNEIGRRTSSLVSRSSSIIQQSSRKTITIAPYVLENQTGYQIELTVIINNYNQKKYHSQLIDNQDEYGIQFEGRDEKRAYSVMIISKEFKFSQLCNLNFTKRTDTAKLFSYKIGSQEKQTRIIISLQMKDQQKRMILCSEIKFFNQTTENIEVEVINKNTQQLMNLILKSQNISYLPLGFEQSMIRFKYQRNGVLSQLMDLQKLTQKNANYNLFIQEPFLILSIQKPIITTMPIVLNLLSPFAIKNLLVLPIDILIKENISRLESNQSFHIFQSNLLKGIQFKFKLPGFHPTQFIDLNLQFQSKEIIIRDYYGLELQLCLNQIQDGEGLFTVAIDGGLTIINSLGMDLYYFTKTQQDLQYQPGQPIKQITEEEDKLREKGNIQIINLVNNLCFSFDSLNLETGPSQVSQPLNIANEGTVLFQIPIDQGYMDILIEISTSQLYEISNKKIININPKYIIINNLNTNLTIQQDRSNQEILIMPGSKFPYYWAKLKNQQLIKFKKKDQQSGVISVLQLGSVLLPLRNQSGQLVDYISVNILEEDKIRYIVISETKQKPLYHLINQLNYDISFYQSKLSDLNFNIKTNLPQNSSIDYSFDNPGQKNSIILELFKDGQFSNFVEVQLANQNSQIEYEMIDNEKFYLNSEFSLELQQMVVILSNERKIPHKINYDHLNNKFIFYTPKIVISIINSHPREELITISIDKFEFIRLQDILDTSQLRIENLQIDNNQQSRCTYPVLLTQQNQQQQAQQIPILSFLLRRAHQINYINYYETVKLAIQPITIKITQGTYDELEEYLKSLKWIDEYQPIKLRVWQIEKKLLQQLYFFETLEIYPINMQLSFQKIGSKKRQYFKSAASQAVNCDEVSILIKGYSVRNCYTSIEQLENKMKQNYQEALQSQIYKLAASIDLLGNPAGLISNVGEGFSDLIEMPYEGFIQGPLEGGLGIVKGMGSLTKGVVSGTFNSVSKITGSVASGISQLSMDDHYLQMRQNQNSKKPKTVVHGLGQGMISLFSGVGHGISGLVVQPYQGAEQGGVGGFFKGVSKGLAGLVVKPVAGALDLVSKTSEGVKNTANFFDDKPNEKRERIPRVFYGFEQKFKNYNLQDSEIMYILERLRPGQVLIDTFVFTLTQYKFAYVITEELFILLEILKKQVLIQFSHENLKAFECSGKEFRIYFYKPQIEFKERAKVKASISFDQKKAFLQINQQEKVIHEFLNYYLERILIKDF